MSPAAVLPFCFVASHSSTIEALRSRGEVHVFYFFLYLPAGSLWGRQSRFGNAQIYQAAGTNIPIL
jgi:hypothetical protein